ncbi:MAG: ribosome assembly cofactor RimP [Bacteroidales bacterium]|nr:ribosome assembly cofactor RimP [Bacteroidales bacterium]
MISKQKLENQIEQILEGSNKFLVDLKLSSSNIIRVFIDGDSGVSVDDCIKLSRRIEEEYDRDSEDFELQVSSAGLDTPLRHIRQFIKNIGRDIKIQTQKDDQFTAKLLSAKDNTIELEHKFMQKAPNAKKKSEVIENISLKIDDIKSAKIVISF